MAMPIFVSGNHINTRLFYDVQFTLMEKGRRGLCFIYTFQIQYAVPFIFFQAGLSEEFFLT